MVGGSGVNGSLSGMGIAGEGRGGGYLMGSGSLGRVFILGMYSGASTDSLVDVLSGCRRRLLRRITFPFEFTNSYERVLTLLVT